MVTRSSGIVPSIRVSVTSHFMVVVRFRLAVEPAMLGADSTRARVQKGQKLIA